MIFRLPKKSGGSSTFFPIKVGVGVVVVGGTMDPFVSFFSLKPVYSYLCLVNQGGSAGSVSGGQASSREQMEAMRRCLPKRSWLWVTANIPLWFRSYGSTGT